VVGGVTGAIARGAGRTRLELEWSGLALVLHAGLAFVLVPRFGLEGALWAIAAANLLATPWFTWRLARTLGWREARLQWEPWLLPPLAAALGARFALLEWGRLGAPWASALVSAVLAVLVTLAVLRITRYLDPTDLRAALARGGGR
jgi:O-antigen/teichoic acid export membrane protein